MAKKITRSQKVAIQNISKMIDIDDLKEWNPKSFILISSDYSSFNFSEKLVTKKDFITIPIKMLKKELEI